MNTINTRLSISRNSSGMINIRIRDESSRNEFINLKISPENFGLALTGLSEMECYAEVNKLSIVGKYKVTEKRSVECPVDTYDKSVLSEWIINNCQEEGWELNTYLGSQNSVVYRNNQRVLNYSVVKYVEKDHNEIQS